MASLYKHWEMSQKRWKSLQSTCGFPVIWGNFGGPYLKFRGVNQKSPWSKSRSILRVHIKIMSSSARYLLVCNKRAGTLSRKKHRPDISPICLMCVARLYCTLSKKKKKKKKYIYNLIHEGTGNTGI